MRSFLQPAQPSCRPPQTTDATRVHQAAPPSAGDAAAPVPQRSLLPLNDAQRDGAHHLSGGLLCIQAGPGSGKTRVITARVDFLCDVVGVPPQRIVVLTFSNKAAAELKVRIKRRGVRISTFHAFCALLLRRVGAAREVGVRPNWRNVDGKEQRELVRLLLSREADEPGAREGSGRAESDDGGGDERAGNDVGASGGRHSSVDEHLKAILECKVLQQLGSWPPPATGTGTGANDAWDHARVQQLTHRYVTLLGERNALDFDDLLLKGLAMLTRPQTGQQLSGEIMHMLVDEFQDTSKLQCALLSAATAVHRNLTVVGDPNQCIYSWRAAERSNLATLEASWSAAQRKRVTLAQSYRSTQRVLRCAKPHLA